MLFTVLMLAALGSGTAIYVLQSEIVQYGLTIAVNPIGGGSVSPSSGDYHSGTQVTLTATPWSGYRFDHWSGDATGTSSTITVTMNSNKSVIANFTRIDYELSTSVSPSGSGSVSPSGSTYDSGGERVTLTATPWSGYRFDHWSGDATGTSSTITVTMNSNKSVIANFTKVKYRLSTSVSPLESGSITPSSGEYDSDTQVTLTATPSASWEFDHWSGTDDNRVNPTSVTMTGNKDITAYFVAKDTDGDGFMDGDDLFPLYDAYVKVSIKYFEDTCAWGVSADMLDFGDPYFKVWVGSTKKESSHPIALDVASMHNPYSASFDVPDNMQFVSVEIEVWDEDSWDFDDPYDASSASGSCPDGCVYKKQFNLLGGTVTETSDGAADGNLQGPQAKIIVEIVVVPQ